MAHQYRQQHASRPPESGNTNPYGGPSGYNPAAAAGGDGSYNYQQFGGVGGGGVNVFNPGAVRSNVGTAAAAASGGGAGGQAAAPGMEGFGLDALAAAANSQAFTMGVGMGQEYLSANVKRYIPWFTAFWQGLKKRQWRREVKDSGISGGVDASSGGGAVVSKQHHYQIPMLDDNAPDLYIPLMAFITYILVTGYAKGTKNSFTPEVLVEVTTSCLVMQILEITVIRLGLYLLQAPASVMDLLAVTGYKYVALNINMLLGLILGTSLYFMVMLYTGLAMAYFSLKTFAQAVRLAGPRDLSSAPVRVELMVLGFALLQFFSVWWLGYSGDLGSGS